MSGFDPQGFYDIGLTIAEQHAGEAGFRTSIDRVYFACHLVGMASVTSKGWYKAKNRADDHSGVCRIIAEHGSKPLADKLRALIELREHADYHVTRDMRGGCPVCEGLTNESALVDRPTWERARAIASDILPKLKSIMPSNLRT